MKSSVGVVVVLSIAVSTVLTAQPEGDVGSRTLRKALVASSLGATTPPPLRTVTPPGAYALSIDGDFELGGFVFKDGYPFLHDDGYANTAFGRNALVDNTTGYGNTANGTGALMANTTGRYNTASGSGALFLNNTGSYNTACGANALDLNTTGSNNTATGAYALFASTYGQRNTASGSSALVSNSEGDENTAMGFLALSSNTTGDRNTAIGAYALSSQSTGYANIALGQNAGVNITTGKHNILIGNRGVGSDSYAIRIGEFQASTFIDGIFGVTASGGSAVFVNSSNQLGTATSSRRYKQEIADMGDASVGLLALRPVSFRYTEEAAGNGPRPVEFGLIAEEVAGVYPDLVVYDEEGKPYSVRYHALTPMLLNELQEQHREMMLHRWALGAVLLGAAAMAGRGLRRSGLTPRSV